MPEGVDWGFRVVEDGGGMPWNRAPPLPNLAGDWQEQSAGVPFHSVSPERRRGWELQPKYWRGLGMKQEGKRWGQGDVRREGMPSIGSWEECVFLEVGGGAGQKTELAFFYELALKMILL